MSYFDFYNIPISFTVDGAALKRIFYANSKKYHPDFFTLETAEKQAEILELSTLNTQAYKTLSNFDKRMKYILDLKGVMAEEGKNQLPQDFLMDMMDINEALMELEFDFDETAYRKALKNLEDIENQLITEANPLIENYDKNSGNTEGDKDFRIEISDFRVHPKSEISIPKSNSTDETIKILESIKIFYLKKRYLLRIRENLSKFASLLK